MATRKKTAAAGNAANDRQKALDLAMSQIEKDFGKGAVMRLGDDERPPIQVIPSGNIAINVALGIGGFPRGRIVEIYGPESSGKTTVALHAIAEAQRAGGIAAFVDAEHALDPDYARKLGVDTDNLLVSQPDTGEQALEIADMLVRSGAIDIIVVDSVAALTPKAEIDGDMIKYHGTENIGMAADTERGLVVPVIKNAGDLNLAGLARQIGELGAKAKGNKLGPDDLQGATFTITNTGSGGALFDTPIVPNPQVGILGCGTIVKRPMVITTEAGDEVIAIRSMMYLFLSYDHRLVDGGDAARFLTFMKKRLEEGAFEGELGL